MFTFLFILAGIYIVYRLLRPRRHEQGPYAPGGGYGSWGMGNMAGGMILGYLLTHYLIDQNQYDMWRNLSDGQLRDTLAAQGILTTDDYDDLASQAAEGSLPDAGDGNAADWVNGNSDSAETGSFDDYNDGGFGGDDFGGFDS